jgi:hypothetical protein
MMWTEKEAFDIIHPGDICTHPIICIDSPNLGRSKQEVEEVRSLIPGEGYSTMYKGKEKEMDFPSFCWT